LAGKVQRLIQQMELTRPSIADPKVRRHYLEQEMELLRLIDRNAEYSAAALAYTESEVYRTNRGNRVKREWLEEILNSNP